MILHKKIFLLIITLLLFSKFANAAYNANNAVAYAQLWAQLRNPQYKDFGNVDCTNFLGQSFRAGGLSDSKMYYNTPPPGIVTGGGSTLPPKSTLIYNHIGNWYYINGNTSNPSSTSYSESWSVANTMYRRMKAGYDNWYYAGSGILSNTSNILVNYGDVVFAEWQPNPTNPIINHAMIVTGFYKIGAVYYPRLSYHSKERLNNPFSTFKTAALADYPNTKVYVFRRSSIVVTPPTWQVF